MYIVLIGILALYFYKRNNRENLGEFLGLRIGFWQVVVVASMGCTILTLFVFNWTNFITF